MKEIQIALIVALLGALVYVCKDMIPKVGSVIVRAAADAGGVADAAEPVDDAAFAYEGRQFSAFIEDSMGRCGGGSAAVFYNWFEKEYASSTVKYPGREALTISEVLEWKKSELAQVADPARKAAEEMSFALWLHKMVKGTIRKFSLDRGFEFCQTVKLGERQCHLQSVLIAGMLQRTGMNGGVAIVYKNIAGQDTNNGHVVPLLKLSDGRDILVDASDPEPFVQQKGLLVRTSDYVYLRPVYEGKTGLISHYITAWDTRVVPVSRVRGLDVSFIDSQFWYYRGERAAGGLLSGKTKSGLSEAEKSFLNSIKLNPRNPLTVYMLARVEQQLGKTKQARERYKRAVQIYKSFGWVPDGPKKAAAGG